MRWVMADKQWRVGAFSNYWWSADGTPDGRPKKPTEMPSVQVGVDGETQGRAEHVPNQFSNCVTDTLLRDSKLVEPRLVEDVGRLS